MTAFGNLRIVAAADFGGAGRQESDPVLYHWPWYWLLPRLAPWLLLTLAIILPRVNRDARALLIFIPLLVLSLLWPSVAKRAGIGPVSTEEYGLSFESLVVGVALLWLNADKLGKSPGLMQFAVSLGLVLLAGLAGVVSFGRASMDNLSPFLGLIALAGSVLLIALAATRRSLRRRYKPLPFTLHLGFWSLLSSTAGMAAVTLVVGAFGGFGASSNLPSALREALRFGLLLGVCLYAINLPYMLLAFRSPFFRRRFCTWLGVESLPQQRAEVPGASGP